MKSMIKIILRRVFPPILILVVFGLLAQLMMSTQKTPEQKEEEVPLPIVDVMAVESETVSLNLPSYGVVQPKNKTQLVTEVQGRMLTISDKFVAGGIVKRGDMLAQIEPSDYEADLMQAQATLAQAKAALDEEIARGEVAKNDWKGYDGGVPPELGLRLPQLKKEQANVKFAEAALARAQRNLERTTIRAPFDGIIVTAASREIPPALVDQLKPGGHLVIPVGSRWGYQSLMLVTKDADGGVQEKEVLGVAFVPLVRDSEEAGGTD